MTALTWTVSQRVTLREVTCATTPREGRVMSDA